MASSCGVCILDSRYKWKQFGTPNEEKTFGIVAMTWWEGDIEGDTEEETEDLLVAIIQSNNGRQYLSCWSPRRLDLARQLLELNDPYPTEPECSSTAKFSWGIPLSKKVKATSVSLVGEPRKCTRSKKQARRAVVLVASGNMDTCEMDYSTFHLQLTTRNAGSAVTFAEKKPYSILAKPSVHGTLKNGARSVGPISSVYLAGASFCFDLEKFGKTNMQTIVVKHLNFLIHFSQFFPFRRRDSRGLRCHSWRRANAWRLGGHIVGQNGKSLVCPCR